MRIREVFFMYKIITTVPFRQQECIRSKAQPRFGIEIQALTI